MKLVFDNNASSLSNFTFFWKIIESIWLEFCIVSELESYMTCIFEQRVKLKKNWHDVNLHELFDFLFLNLFSIFIFI